jgi:hypothetical protein
MRRDARGVLLDTKEKFRTDQHRSQTHFDAVFEAARRQDLLRERIPRGEYREPLVAVEAGVTHVQGTANGNIWGARELVQKGAVTTIRYPDNTEIMPQVELRFIFDLYAGVRPCRLIPGIPSPIVGAVEHGIDLVVIREAYPDRFHNESRGKPGLREAASDALILGVHTPARITFRSWFLSLRIVGTRLAVVIE